MLQLVDCNEAAAFGADEQVIVAAEPAERHRFRLGTLVFRSVFRIVPDRDCQLLEFAAAIELDVAVAIENSEPAAATEQVSLVRRGNSIIAITKCYPGDRIGFARYSGNVVRQRNQAVFIVVNVDEIHCAHREMTSNRAAGEANDRDMVVFLQRNDGFVVVIDIDEFRLGVVRRVLRQASEVNLPHCPFFRGANKIDNELRQTTFLAIDDNIFIALVFDGDGCIFAIGADFE